MIDQQKSSRPCWGRTICLQVILFDVLLPLILVLGLGYALGRTGFFAKEFVFGLNRLVYYVGLPALVVHSLASARLDRAALFLSVAFSGVVLVAAGIAWVLARAARLEPSKAGSFVQATFRGNLAYVALPVLLAMFRDHPDRERIMALAILVLGPSMVLFNVVSAVVLLSVGASTGRDRAVAVLKSVGTNPLILASLAGLAFALLRVPVPGPLDHALKMVGELSVPAALICVGAVMALVHIGPSWKPALGAALVKTGLVPVLGWLMGRLTGLEDGALSVLLVFSCCPTAVASYIMAVQMGGDEGVASQSIVFSTVLCFVPLSILLLAA